MSIIDTIKTTIADWLHGPGRRVRHEDVYGETAGYSTETGHRQPFPTPRAWREILKDKLDQPDIKKLMGDPAADAFIGFEDNWWFDYLHNNAAFEWELRKIREALDAEEERQEEERRMQYLSAYEDACLEHALRHVASAETFEDFTAFIDANAEEFRGKVAALDASTMTRCYVPMIEWDEGSKEYVVRIVECSSFDGKPGGYSNPFMIGTGETPDEAIASFRKCIETICKDVLASKAYTASELGGE